MGFEAEDVGKALVAARGDASAALDILRSGEADDNADDDEARQLELALKMSLEQPTSSSSSSSTAGANPLWAPPRYLPKARDALEAGPRTLNLIEQVQVRDGGYAWQRATGFLDTGNGAMTLVSKDFAARHAIYKEAPNIPSLLGGGSRFGMAERWTTIRGVVPGASTSAPVVTIALKIRDQEMLVPAAVSDPGGHHDLLLGADVIGKLFEAGFRLGAGSM